MLHNTFCKQQGYSKFAFLQHLQWKADKNKVDNESELSSGK